MAAYTQPHCRMTAAGGATGAPSRARGRGSSGVVGAARVPAAKGGSLSFGGSLCSSPMRAALHANFRDGRSASRAVRAQAADDSKGGEGSKGNYPKNTVIIVDNYDSFTYNLSQYLGNLSCDHIVIKNDELTIPEVVALEPRGILVSPGPGTPEDSGISMAVVKEFGPLGIPVFGVCMGHQCIGQVFGGNIIRAPCGLMHGKTSPVFHNNNSLLEGLPNPFTAARYHSLVIEKDTWPEDLEMTAWTEDGTCMGVRHKKFPLVQGVQFHPESIITESGLTIVNNWVKTLK